MVKLLSEVLGYFLFWLSSIPPVIRISSVVADFLHFEELRNTYTMTILPIADNSPLQLSFHY